MHVVKGLGKERAPLSFFFAYYFSFDYEKYTLYKYQKKKYFIDLDYVKYVYYNATIGSKNIFPPENYNTTLISSIFK